MKEQLVDCPVLRKPVWDEEDVAVAMDWALERGLLERGFENQYLTHIPPYFYRIAFLSNANTRDKAWKAWSEYQSGRHQAAEDAAHAGMNEVRQTLVYLQHQKHNFSYAFVLGYTEWAREYEEGLR